MDSEQEWLDQKAQVKEDIDALISAGIPLGTARRLSGWNITLEYASFSDLTQWPPPPVASVPADGLRQSLKLLASRSEGRVNAESLEGAVLDAGKEYAVFIPDVPELGITKIDFLLDGSPHHTEFSAPWDYDGTTGGGDSYRVTFVAGAYNIAASITDATGVFSIDADFNVEA